MIKTRKVNETVDVCVFDNLVDKDNQLEITIKNPNIRAHVILTKEEFFQIFDLTVEMGWIKNVTNDPEEELKKNSSKAHWFVMERVKQPDSLNSIPENFILTYEYKIIHVVRGVGPATDDGWRYFAGPFNSYFSAEHFLQFKLS